MEVRSGRRFKCDRYRKNLDQQEGTREALPFPHRGQRELRYIGAGRRQVPRGAKGNEGIANNVGQTKGLIG